MEHLKARTERPAVYPERFHVPNGLVSWSIPWPSGESNPEKLPPYQPAYFVAPVVLANDVNIKPGGWADPEDIHCVTREIRSDEGPIEFDSLGRPLNPLGRTGIAGRGLLGKWGPNFAADPIVTRDNPQTGELEMLAIQRRDSGEWAIPGGMVDEGESVSETLAREFREEAGVDLNLDDAVEIYRGYVDDPRNTDHAWMESTVCHKHLDSSLAEQIRPIAGDDAADVRWIPLTEDHIDNLYASHASFVRTVANRALVGLQPRRVELRSEEIEALATLDGCQPPSPQRVILFTDPNKDPDDMATYVFAKALSDRGFVSIAGVVTTLGDARLRYRRARFAKGVFAEMGMDVPVAAGLDYPRDRKQCREHQVFLMDQFLAAPDSLHHESKAMLREALNASDDRSLTLTVIAGMTDAAALIADEPELVHRKVGRVVIMGGLLDTLDSEGLVAPDLRAYNNATDFAAAKSFYRDVQRVGIPMTVLSKEAAYRAAAPLEFYKGIRSTAHPVGVALHEIQRDALEGLWDGINADLIAHLSKEWFVETFTYLKPKQVEAQRLLADDVDFADVWKCVTKLNLYDPLTLLASTPGVRELLFDPADVATHSGAPVQWIGDQAIRKPELTRLLLSALGIVALRA